MASNFPLYLQPYLVYRHQVHRLFSRDPALVYPFPSSVVDDADNAASLRVVVAGVADGAFEKHVGDCAN